jgi:hypothetical protein
LIDAILMNLGSPETAYPSGARLVLHRGRTI